MLDPSDDDTKLTLGYQKSASKILNAHEPTSRTTGCVGLTCDEFFLYMLPSELRSLACTFLDKWSRQTWMTPLKQSSSAFFSKQRQTCRRLVIVVKHQRGIQHIQFLGKGGDKWILDMEHNQTEVMEPTILHKLFVVRCTGYNFWNITEKSSKSFSANIVHRG
jgi:hypothetical protein